MRRGVDLLIGVRELKAHLRVGSKTLERLVTEENLPVYKLPQRNGRTLWLTSGTLIEEWLRSKIHEAKV